KPCAAYSLVAGVANSTGCHVVGNQSHPNYERCGYCIVANNAGSHVVGNGMIVTQSSPEES
ncbi:MAG: hypothetical protein ACKN9K_24015, partial [Dolichospermum sp.]